MKYSRVCPDCLNQHITYAKSSKAKCEKCKAKNKIIGRNKMEEYRESIRKK